MSDKGVRGLRRQSSQQNHADLEKGGGEGLAGYWIWIVCNLIFAGALHLSYPVS